MGRSRLQVFGVVLFLALIVTIGVGIDGVWRISVDKITPTKTNVGPTETLIQTTTPLSTSISIVYTPTTILSLTHTPLPNTSISTSTPLPTNTPTFAPTFTPTITPTTSIKKPSPTATFTPTPEAVVVSFKGLNLRSGPGTNYDVIGFLREGDFLDIQGRITSNEWIQVVPTNLDRLGWVSANSQYVQINVKLNSVPLGEVPPTPTATLSPTPVNTPTPEFQFASGPELYHPKHGVSYTIGDIVPFKWREYPLRENQFYSIRIFLRDGSDENSCIHVQTQIPEESLKLDCPKGLYKWSVVVATKLPDGSEHEWRTDSMENHEWEFGLGEPHPDQFKDSNGNGGSSEPTPCSRC